MESGAIVIILYLTTTKLIIIIRLERIDSIFFCLDANLLFWFDFNNWLVYETDHYRRDQLLHKKKRFYYYKTE